MSIWTSIRRLFGGGRPGYEIEQLAERLEMTVEELRAIQPRYRSFTVPKRSGGSRTIDAPEDRLKLIQRRILYRVLGGLRAHRCAHGFERGRSIVTNARPHTNMRVVIGLDLRDFFPTTDARRVQRYLRFIGWSRAAAREIVRLTTWQGGLPQGAPTSPRLSNLVNYRLDARLDGLARSFGGHYTRYADDITISLSEDRHEQVFTVTRVARSIVRDFGYEVNERKGGVRRRHQRQQVTGLVVNEGIALPRETRRWLRAVEHHLRTRGSCSLAEDELQGWLAYVSMVHRQGAGAGIPDA